MFITVYYGDQKTLLCNPSCTVVNLLQSIKERCGYGETDQVLDLTDETGLVLELDKHKDECATKYLAYKERYILVEKRVTSPSEDSGERSPTRDVTYVPLLQRLTDNFPQYEARLAQRSPSQLQHSTASRGSTGRSKKVRVKHRKNSQVLERD